MLPGWLPKKSKPAAEGGKASRGARLVKEILQNALEQFIGHGGQNSNKLSDLPRRAASAVVLENPPARVRQDLANQGYTRFCWFVVLPSSKVPRWLFPLGDRHRMLAGFHI